MDSKKILVTGASGFVGACLARDLLDRGNEVHLFLRGSSDIWRLQDRIREFHVHNLDLAEAEKVAAAVSSIKPEKVFHLATYGAYPHQNDAHLSVRTNLLGTMNLIDACKKYAGAIMNVSSSSEYGIKARPMSEKDMLEPNSVYGVTKAAATLYCRYMAQEMNVPITTFRIFAAYGYYEDKKRLIPSMIVPFLKGKSPQLSSPRNVRDFIFIEDIIDALEYAAARPELSGEIFNLGTGKQHTLAEIASTVKEITCSSQDVVWGAVEKKRVEPEMWVADMAKTEKKMGWMPKHDIKSGLAKTVSWFEKNLDIYG